MNENPVGNGVDVEANKDLIRNATEINYHAKIIKETDQLGVLHVALGNMADTLDIMIARLSGATAAVEVLRRELAVMVEKYETCRGDLDVALDQADDI